MQDRRFSQEEAERILAGAARRQEEVRPEPDPHLTLEEIEEAARSAGIDASHVRAAAADVLRPSKGPPLRTFLRIPVEIRVSRVIPTRPDDIDWAAAVVGLRRLFRKQGVATDLGAVREWTSDPSESRMPVRVVLEPESDGSRVTVERMTWPSTAGILSGAATMLAVSLIIAGLWIAGGGATNIWIPALVFGLSAVLVAVGGHRLLSRSGARTLDRFREVLDLIEKSTTAPPRITEHGGITTVVSEREPDATAPAPKLLDPDEPRFPDENITRKHTREQER